MVRDRRIERPDPADRRVQVVEQVAADSRGDFCHVQLFTSNHAQTPRWHSSPFGVRSRNCRRGRKGDRAHNGHLGDRRLAGLAEFELRSIDPERFAATDRPARRDATRRAWGVEPVDTTGKKATFLDNKDAFIAALKYRQDLIQTKVSPTPVTPDNTNEVFGGQKLLAYDVWPFFIEILPDTYKGKFDVDFVLAPTLKKGKLLCIGFSEETYRQLVRQQS